MNVIAQHSKTLGAGFGAALAALAIFGLKQWGHVTLDPATAAALAVVVTGLITYVSPANAGGS